MEKRPFLLTGFRWVDLYVLLFLGAILGGILFLTKQWPHDFEPQAPINLSLSSLPLYALFSLSRNFLAYFISLFFALIFGYWAAKSSSAEKLLLPIMDVLQCIPVLGFLPVILLGVMSLFPRSHLGVELSSILMIVSSQVWNLAFCIFTSLRGIPSEYSEVASSLRLSWFQKMRRVELPYAAPSIIWNSLLSVAGGWFFLIICEAFTLGDTSFRLAGMGSYMAEAIRQGDQRAMWAGVGAMFLLVIFVEFVVWKPLLAWVVKYRNENDELEVGSSEVLMDLSNQESWILDQVRDVWQLLREKIQEYVSAEKSLFPKKIANLLRFVRKGTQARISQIGIWIVILSAALILGFGFSRLIFNLQQVSSGDWLLIFSSALSTLVRVFLSTVLSTLWMLPFGIWVGLNLRYMKRVQPWIQILASFPAPMLFPLVLGLLFWGGIHFGVSSILLMTFAIQWYVFMNVVAGAVRIPEELQSVSKILDLNLWNRFWKLYAPSVFPHLLTGWVTAAGAAWNCSIVTEYIVYNGSVLKTPGIGAQISMSAENANFPILVASLCAMIVLIVVLNRIVWIPLFRLAETHFYGDENL